MILFELKHFLSHDTELVYSDNSTRTLDCTWHYKDYACVTIISDTLCCYNLTKDYRQVSKKELLEQIKLNKERIDEITGVTLKQKKSLLKHKLKSIDKDF